MLSELDLLLDVTRRLEEASLDYMLTGSLALNHSAQPRMTRDIEIVLALLLKNLETLPKIFGDDFYFSPDAAREVILHQSCPMQPFAARLVLGQPGVCREAARAFGKADEGQEENVASLPENATGDGAR